MVRLFHGDNATTSLSNFDSTLASAKKNGATLTMLDGKKLTPAELDAALNQSDFFLSPVAVAIKNLFARPKSKIRDQIVSTLLATPADVFLWEAKKLTPATLKSLAGAQVSVANQTEKIWSLVAQLAPTNANAKFVTTYQECLAQAAAKNPNSAPAIYVLATLLWQVQQLIDAKQNNFHGVPFQASRIQAQAHKFTLPQLLSLHRQLINLDAAAKTGGLKFDLSIQLLTLLLPLN